MRYWLMKASTYAADIKPQFQGQDWPYYGIRRDDRLGEGDVVYLVQEGYGLYGWGFVTQIEPNSNGNAEEDLMRVVVSRPVVQVGLIPSEIVLSLPSFAKAWSSTENFTELDFDQVSLLNSVLGDRTSFVPPNPVPNKIQSSLDSSEESVQNHAAVISNANSASRSVDEEFPPRGDVLVTLKCPQCDSQIRDSARFCDKCGTNLEKFEAVTVAGPANNILSNETSDAWIGRTVGLKYELLDKLGEGNIGVVYKARRNDIALELAIKLLHSKHSSDKKFVERLKREAAAGSRIHHPNVLTIHDFGEGDASSPAFIAMELISGDSLDTILKRESRLTPQRAVLLMREICKGVGAGHRLGIVHRDLKPANIMIVKADEDEPERIKVLDFGLAKLSDLNVGNAITEVGSVMGTPIYMSPEQCLGEQLDSRSDVYSLGILLYEMLTGKPPFQETDFGAIKRQHLTGTPARLPAELNIEPILEEIIMRSLSKEAEKRQMDAGMLGLELKKVWDI